MTVGTRVTDDGATLRASTGWMLPVAGVGILVRVAVCLLSTGSNDIRTWERFGRAVREAGLAALYQSDPLFNHPPLMGLYSAAVGGLADGLDLTFPVLFKLPMVAADGLVLLLLYRSVSRSEGPGTGARAAVVWAWAPAAILITAFHGNTDALCTALTLSSALVVVRCKRPFAGGLLMGAALNVKLIPVLVAPAVFALAGGRRGMTRFVAGTAVGALPFAVALAAGGMPVLRNLLGWSGTPELWGVFGVLRPIGHRLSEAYPSAPAVVEGLAGVARYVLLGAVVALPLHARVTGRRLDVRLPALVTLLFLLLASGFGIQYVHYVLPFVLLVDLAGGAVLAGISGVFVAAAYGAFMVSWLPMESLHTGRFPIPVALLGALTWLVLAALFVRIWRLPTASAEQASGAAASKA